MIKFILSGTYLHRRNAY